MGEIISPSIYLWKEKAQNSRRDVFSYAQLAHLMEINRNAVKVYASRLVKKNLAFKPFDGRVSFTTDRFVVATQLIEPSYISFGSALYLHELTTQIPVTVECITTRNTIHFPDLEVDYHTISPGLFFGYLEMKRGRSYAFVATPEKSVLDSIYFSREPMNHFDYLIKSLDHEKMKSYSKKYATQWRGRKVVKWVLENVG